MNYTEKLLEVCDLHKVYTKDGVPTKALNGISFNVLNGEYLGIMGASGSGKTTLLNCIATVIKPTSGQILLSGANISSFDGTKLAEYRGNKIGYLFQDFALLDNLTGKENIILPLSIHNIDIVTAEKKLKDIADFLGITDVLSKFPSQMSGGQKQRVAAARSLISDPDIILADEPTGALDTKSARLVNEGLAENFATFLYGEDKAGPWVTKTDIETLNEYIKPIIRDGLNVQGLENLNAYLYGDEMAALQNYPQVGLPYCSGYACGYHLIKHYLQKTGKNIVEATLLPAKEILNATEDFWNE